MYGWLVTKNSGTMPECWKKYCSHYKDYQIMYHITPKFLNDRIFNNDYECLLGTDGVLVNSREIIDKRKNAKELAEILSTGLKESTLELLRELCGPYNGFMIEEERAVFFTNRVGDRPVYYYNDGRSLIVSSNINMIIEFCKFNNIILNLDINAAGILLNRGFMLDERTLVNGIKRLFPGTYLQISEFGIEEVRYHILDNTKWVSDSEDEAIEKIDILFRKAVKRCYDKNEEYGYQHLATLSGGLDSRMTSFVAHDMGYSNIINICFGTPGCDDNILAAKMSGDMKNEFIFKSIDDLKFIYDVDEMVQRTYGGAIFSGPTMALRLIKNLNLDNIGAQFTGLGGDSIIGSFSKNDYHIPPYNKLMGYSKRLSNEIDVSRYLNMEQMEIYTRSFLGANNGTLLVNEYVTSLSPFFDNDFMDYCMKLPLAYRIERRIYTKWILKKYPQAAEYKWTGSNAKIKYNPVVFHKIDVIRKRLPQKIKRVLFQLHVSKHKYCKVGSFPMDYLFERNTEVQTFVKEFIRNNIAYIDQQSPLGIKLKEILKKPTYINCCLVMTILSFVVQHDIRVEK